MLVSLKLPIKRAALLTGLSEQLIGKWRKSGFKDDPSQTKVTVARRAFRSLDNFDEDVVMRAIRHKFEKKRARMCIWKGLKIGIPR